MTTTHLIMLIIAALYFVLAAFHALHVLAEMYRW
jgi:hypothetical protein